LGHFIPVFRLSFAHSPVSLSVILEGIRNCTHCQPFAGSLWHSGDGDRNCKGLQKRGVLLSPSQVPLALEAKGILCKFSLRFSPRTSPPSEYQSIAVFQITFSCASDMPISHRICQAFLLEVQYVNARFHCLLFRIFQRDEPEGPSVRGGDEPAWPERDRAQPLQRTHRLRGAKQQPIEVLHTNCHFPQNDALSHS
jgi:hypothetical protein